MTDVYTPSPHIIANLTSLVNWKGLVMGDFDNFDTAEATADNDKWSSDYYTGSEGGSADINTTTSGKLMIEEDPDGTPAAAGYGVRYLNAMYARYWEAWCDLDVTWGAQTSGAAETGIMLTKGAAYDSTNYLQVARYKTSGTNNIRVTGALNSAGITPITAAVTDDAIALKVIRTGDEYYFYYSTVQSPTENWTFIGMVEDATNYMTNKVSIILIAYTDGNNTDNSVVGDFDNFYMTITSEAWDEIIGIIGRDNADNAFSTSNVASNEDGTLVERLEFIQQNMVPDVSGLAFYGIVTTATSTTKWKAAALAGRGTNMFNDVYYVQFIEADNAAPEGEVEKVSTYDTSDGDFVVGSAYTAAPEVGDQFMVLHESLVMAFMFADASMARVKDDSIFAHILAQDGDVSAFDDTTDSLEALQKALGAWSLDEGTDYNDSIYANLITLSKFIADGTGDYGSGTALAANKSIIDALGQTGDDTSVTGDRDAPVMQERIDAISLAMGVSTAATLTGFEDDGSGANLFKTLIAYQGVTTSAGTTTTIVATDLGSYAADYWNGNKVMMLAGGSAGCVRTIVDFDGTSALTLEPALPASTSTTSAFIILSQKGADWIIGDNNASNAYDSSTVTADEDGSVLERLEFVQQNLVPDVGGLVQYGIVTTATSTTRFKASALAGKGTNVYNDVYYIQFIEADNAAPEGEVQKVSAYDTSDGDFTVGAVYTAAPEVGDQFLVLHESMVIAGRNDADNIFDSSTTAANENGSILERLEQLQEVVNKGSGTAVDGNKSIVDLIGTSGSSILDYFTEYSVMGMFERQHSESYILFIIPEAVGSINTHNTAIQTQLAKLGEVLTITQADALTYPDFESITMAVTGTNNGTGWTVGNLANLKTMPGIPVLCCDATAAAYFEIGTDGGAAGAKTDINGVANIEGSLLGIGYHGLTGIDAGANTIASSTTFDTLDMSDADLTETWLAYESVNANTDVTIGFVNRIQVDGTIGIDEAAAEVTKTYAFYGPAYSANDLNALGAGIIVMIGAILIHSKTIGISVAISGDIGNLQQKLFGNMFGQHSASSPLSAFISGNSGGLGTEMPNNVSLYDVLQYLTNVADGGTNPYPDSVVQESIFAYIMSKSADPVTTSYDNTTDSLEAISDKLGVGVGTKQIVEVSITAALNAGVTTVATVANQACLIKSIVVHADTAAHADMTSCAVKGGAAQVVTFISAATAIEANLDAENKQVSWSGAVRLPTSATVIIDLQGTGANNADLTVTIEYEACVAGGVIA